MKVLIIRNAFTYDFGGAERLTVHLAQELQSQGIETVVVSRQPRLLAYAKEMQAESYRGWWWSRQRWTGKGVLLFPVYVLWQLCLFFWYLQLLLRVRPQVLHILSKDDWIAATFAGKLLGKVVVWTDPADLKHVFRNHHVWYKNPVGKLVYFASKFADHITLVSFSEQRLIEESVGKSLPKQFEVVHSAGRDETVVPLKRQPKDKDAVVFCSTSRLVVAKGIGELIPAFELLAKKHADCRLWLVGDGPDTEMFKAMAGNHPQITFFGHSEKPLEYVAASDVFVQPTHHEGFSLAMAEAAMLGKPLIASNVGGNPELVNESNGILFPVHDTAALAAAMAALAEDPKRREKLGKQARHDYKTQFDFSYVVKEKILPLYEKQ